MLAVSVAHLHSRDPIIPSQIRHVFLRPEAEDVAVIAQFPVTDVSDLVGRMYTMSGIQSLYSPARPVCGVAMTAKCPPGDNLAVVKAVSLATPGDVLVVDAQAFTDWCLGGFQILRAAIEDYGLAGFVLNGTYRDVRDAQEASFPLYGVGIAPWSGPKAGPIEINVPACCGGVIVNPGDVISASVEGVVIVPREYTKLVAENLVGNLKRGKSAADKDNEAKAVADFIRKAGHHIDEAFAKGGGVYLDTEDSQR